MRLRPLVALATCVASFSACVSGDHGTRPAPLGAAKEPLSQALGLEGEPNNAFATATDLGALPAVAEGTIFPTGDVDYYRFDAAAGDRLYAATMTGGSSSGAVDTTLDLLGPDGVTVIESDLDDGVFGATASSISGAVLAAAGTYYLRVTGVTQIRPYQLHAMLKSGVPFAEFEPNNNLINAQPLPAGRWIAGDLLDTGTDNDYYTFPLDAGDTLYASLDLDPERDGDWAGQLIFGKVGGSAIGVNDAGGVAGPDSEAFFYTVRSAGNYYLRVTAGVAGSYGTYQLAMSVMPFPAQVGCSTYTSADVPKTVPAAGGKVTSTITVPAGVRVGSMTVAMSLDHTAMPDVDAHLQSPAGNDNALFTDVGNASNPSMNIELSDSAALPVNSSPVLNMGIVQPELAYRLRWFDGEDAGGTWTLNLEDDTNNVDGGTLNGWSITICAPPPAVPCPAGAYPVTLLDADFEASAAGFTHAGALDEWARGTPAGTVIASCASGTQCWKTNLAGNYGVNTSGDLLSPAVNLGNTVAPLRLRWSQKYQINNATNDHASVDIVPSVGAPLRVWEFLDAAMSTPVGLAPTTIQESAGWGVVEQNLDAFAGQSVQVKVHFDSDNLGVMAGYAIDDVKVTACRMNACGDGVLFGGEVCDDGNAVSGDGCDPNCTVSACGNGVKSASEGCDDGNLLDGDGCDGNCTPTACGNGVKSAGEGCDDGNLIDGDGCDQNCTTSGCGNGVVAAGETCDDSNAVSGDGCDANCTFTACGNGVTTMSEGCDDGNLLDGDGCDGNCTVTACGNGVLTMGEACDDANLVDGDGCDQNCTVTACGNGVVTMGEACDDGNLIDGDGCDAPCIVTACGNGVLTMGEACDDANLVDGDGCDGNCTVTACGNGVLTAGEACDDGNTAPGDGCDASCQKESMGVGGAGGGGGAGGTGGMGGAGAGTGGMGAGTGGTSATTGVTTSAGTGGEGGSASTTTATTGGTTGASTTGGGDPGSTGGCGCAVPGERAPLLPPWAPAVGLAALALGRRRRSAAA